VVARGLSYSGRRRTANPNEGGDVGGKKTSGRNTSEDDEEGEVVGHAWQKIGETHVFKRGRQKVNCLPRFVRHPIPSKPSHRSAQLRSRTNRLLPLVGCVERWIDGH
jgi:hypothetical protein